MPGRLSVKIPAVDRRCVPAPSKGTLARGACAVPGQNAGASPMRTARPVSRGSALPAALENVFRMPATRPHALKTAMAPWSTGTNSKV